MRRAALIIAMLSALSACSPAAADKPTRTQVVREMREEERQCPAGAEGESFERNPHCVKFGKLVERLEDEYNLCMMFDRLYLNCAIDAPYPETY